MVNINEINKFENEIINLNLLMQDYIKDLKKVKIPKQFLNYDQLFKYDEEEVDILDDYYDWYIKCFTPYHYMNFYRHTRLRYIYKILKSMLFSYQKNRILEYAFSCRHLLEVTATFNFGIDKFLELVKPVLNTNVKIESKDINKKVQFVESFLGKDNFFYQDCLLPLFREQNKIVMPTTIKWKEIIEKDFLINNNETIKPKKNDQEYILKAESVTRDCLYFEEKIQNFRPTYDLLSEFVHPNSFVSMLYLQVDYNSQFDQSTINDFKKNELAFWEIFIKNNINKTIENIICEIKKSDVFFVNHITNYKEHIKTLIKNTLGLIGFHSYISYNPTIQKFRCLCDSGRFIHFCCIKTSDTDQKLLKKFNALKSQLKSKDN